MTENHLFLILLEEQKKILMDKQLDHEYLPIGGLATYCQFAAKLIFGEDSALLKEGKVVSVQTLSGTGALRVSGAFLQRFLNNSEIYMPNPTWANHIPIYTDSGIKVNSYTYYDPKTFGLNFKGMVEDLSKAPKHSIILLHACAHNPTGVDPSQDQWKQIANLCQEKEHFVLFDSAYQGFASGDFVRDAFPIRHFVSQGLQVGVCQSFAKNFGLYGERAGAFHLVCDNPTVAQAVDSQLKILIRPMYSNPPLYPARIVSTILSDPQLYTLWSEEVKAMANRIISMRVKLSQELKRLGSKRDWSHITDQIGMFCFSGLTPEQTDELKNNHHIYLTRNGRISLVGLTTKNVGYLANAMHIVTSK